MKQLILVLTIILGITGILAQAQAQQIPFIADGSLNEWGVTPGYDWDPFPGIISAVEDFLPEDDPEGRVYPGWGGQTFDAEAMYVKTDANNLYYAIVTGMPPEGAFGLLPGDIFINFNNQGFEYGIAVPDHYSYLPTDAASINAHNAPENGALYAVDPEIDLDWSCWEQETWLNLGDIDIPVKIHDYIYYADGNYEGKKGAQYLAGGTFDYSKFVLTIMPSSTPGAAGTDDVRYVIEGSVPIEAFGTDWGKSFEMVWSQTCGNDIIRVQYNAVPEPSTLLLFGMGAIGTLGRILRRKES